ncbi:MAG: hypothetical protein C0171_03885 [Caldisphaera sp.]|uniref:Asp-tRNA(Asn)/Glu-tRNA(Gln) amidotransferase subunit GatC n=1 Tax=Caldisphaera sp. TaxID=2060322 RepID=UPI000CA9B603|nr:MAG: hypothetical protein C0201_04250 [Caldisphaera sp.]PMP90913.1 MAG: hypothetical protein C0171_03885 [Caldisphaera sp.]
MSKKCDKDIINELLDLSRINFTEEELEKLCKDIDEIRSLLNQVSSLGSLNVKPLYNVWDSELNPPYSVNIEKVNIYDLIPNERVAQNKIKIPWRGE